MQFWKDKKILVVDDEEGIRDVLSFELEFHGAICVQAGNGKIAFDLYRDNKFDAVISDMRMPEADGLYFLKKIKDQKLEVVPMIFLTAYTEVPFEEIYGLGAYAILSKPFDLNHVVRNLEVAIRDSHRLFRLSPRISVVVNVSVQWMGQKEPVLATTFNLGRGGMFVQYTGNPPLIGDVVDFTIYYSEGERPESVTGQMINRWNRLGEDHNLPPGFGGEFINLDDEQRSQITRLIGIQ